MVFVIKTRKCFQKTYRKSDIASYWTCCLLFDLVDFLHRNGRCTNRCWFIHRFNFLFKLAMRSTITSLPLSTLVLIDHLSFFFSFSPPLITMKKWNHNNYRSNNNSNRRLFLFRLKMKNTKFPLASKWWYSIVSIDLQFMNWILLSVAAAAAIATAISSMLMEF